MSVEEKSDDHKDDDENKSNHSDFSNSNSSRREPNEETKERKKEKEHKKEKQSILTWPKGLFNQIVYVILYPFHLIYWLVMPNIYYKPEIIKV